MEQKDISGAVGGATPMVIIGGVKYEAAGAIPEVNGLIQDLTIVQKELNRIKVTYDITTIAKQALLETISDAIASGESGLVEIIDTDTDTEEGK